MWRVKTGRRSAACRHLPSFQMRLVQLIKERATKKLKGESASRQSVAQRIPEELLVQIFALLQHAADTLRAEDVWIPHDRTGPPAKTLRAAISVCRSWSGPAAHAFYVNLRPSDLAAIVSLARTLEERKDLAQRVSFIRIPFDAFVIALRGFRQSAFDGFSSIVFRGLLRPTAKDNLRKLAAAMINLRILCVPFRDVELDERDYAFLDSLGLAAKIERLQLRSGISQRSARLSLGEVRITSNAIHISPMI